jgi:hypothetical protein
MMVLIKTECVDKKWNETLNEIREELKREKFLI